MRQIVLGILVTGVLSTPALAQAQVGSTLKLDRALAGVTFTTAARAAQAAAAAPETPIATFLVGADFPSLYMFRGIRQESDPAFTFQPYLDVGIAASDTATINIGTWNSIHSGSNSDAFDGGFYESDFYASATFTAGSVKPGVIYTAYMSPSDAFNTVHELGVFASFDDSANPIAFAPKVSLAFELGDAHADGGPEKGVYFELFGKPSFALGSSPVTLGIPLKLGMSLKDYYENPLTGEDSKFGFFQIGLSLGVPVGRGEVHGGVDFYTLGETLELFNQDEKTQAVGSVGFSFTF